MIVKALTRESVAQLHAVERQLEQEIEEETGFVPPATMDDHELCAQIFALYSEIRSMSLRCDLVDRLMDEDERMMKARES
jgi:hypothetical protein